MGLVKIKKNTNGDSRVADHVPTFREFREANISHADDVKRLMDEFLDLTLKDAYSHDYTKLNEPYESLFYRNLCDAIEGKIKFDDCEWIKLHYKQERHHLDKYCPEDVDLSDVIEMICDCVAAGKARSGTVPDIKISNEVLQKAIQNTVKLLDSWVVVVEKEE